MVVILRRMREKSSTTIGETQVMRLKSLRILGILACLGFLAFQGNWVGLLCCLLIIVLMRLKVLPQPPPLPPLKPSKKAMAILDVVTGMTAAPRSDFSKSIPIMTLKDGAVVRTWKNLVGYDHVFLSDSEGNIIYGGFVGWIHCKGLQDAIAQIRRELT